jgi:hypothetical protein
MIRLAFIWLILLAPTVLWAQGLVPCGGVGQAMCGYCHFAELVHNVMGWLAAISFTIMVIVIAAAGVMSAASLGSVSTKAYAIRLVQSTVVGFFLIMLGWVLVDFVLKSFLTDAAYGVWNDLTCGIDMLE